MKFGFVLSFLISSLSVFSYASQPIPRSPFNQRCTATYVMQGATKTIHHAIPCNDARQFLAKVQAETLKQFQICLKRTGDTGAKPQCYSPRENVACTVAINEIDKVKAVTIND